MKIKLSISFSHVKPTPGPPVPALTLQPQAPGRVIIIIIIIVIIIIIIIAFKGAIRDFLQSPHSATNRLQRVRSSGPGAIVCKSRATHRTLITRNMSCHVPPGTKGQLSY